MGVSDKRFVNENLLTMYSLNTREILVCTNPHEFSVPKLWLHEYASSTREQTTILI